MNKLQELEQALAPIYPALVLDIEYGKLDVNATVYQGDEPFEAVVSFDLTTSAARSYLDKASRLCIAGDEASPEAFNATLTALEGGIAVVDPDLPPTCKVDDLTDLVKGELRFAPCVVVQIGAAKWRVEA